jgi:Uma2 family endonuclease
LDGDSVDDVLQTIRIVVPHADWMVIGSRPRIVSTRVKWIPRCVYLFGESSGKTVPARVPDLIFKFVSQDRLDQERDYIDKRREYYIIGVREYVIVDRFKQAVLVLSYQDGGDFAEHSLKANETYVTPLLPGLTVDLAEVFTSIVS